MSEKFVMAIGDNGHSELMPESETVTIGAVPVGSDNCIVPATLRFLRRSENEGRPTRLLRILRPNTRLNRRPHARVCFACTPFERYRLEGKSILGREDSCFVRGDADARDALFHSLTIKERFRILSVVHKTGGTP